ncbi:type II toxin-antitoxin system VapB family antitoxin [Neoaquamicrobium sediminum]|uniref:type II toxin-antitoxin system VapB family antitoxin n=1 Tax=Neoaquamicrobium sediminum TaxID=1849104 RepID=UPI00156533D2|nr:type II toxin-antitoxin system VapB family antitoxin [Mesorhizobium sediminum]NRC55591.1 type II toxin-antitoxin system VapB family antitoxin [Mesorhizobium sediminum]
MALHIQDKEADRLLRHFARARRVTLTEAVKLAVLEAEEARRQRDNATEDKLESVLVQIRAARGSRPYRAEDDKAFMDEMWGEDD